MINPYHQVSVYFHLNYKITTRKSWRFQNEGVQIKTKCLYPSNPSCDIKNSYDLQ